MDLLTLVTACSLTVDPKLMHALVWHQSRGEPWAVATESEALPRVYARMHEAIQEIRAKRVGTDKVRIGLAGVPVAPSNVAPAVFLPCRNVAIAASRLAKLADRCRAHPRLKSDPTFCAVAVYRGSWEKPDVEFADAVEISFVRGNAPSFDISNDIGSEFLDMRARIATGGTGPVPVRHRLAEEILEREGLTEAAITAAAIKAAELVDPTTDPYASADFRRHLTRVLTERALLRACGLAQGTR